MNITYRTDIIPEIDEIINLYLSTDFIKPLYNKERIKEMYNYSNLIITAWDRTLLVGIIRSVTDFESCCYIYDFAIQKDYRSEEIEKHFIELINQKMSNNTIPFLFSRPAIKGYSSEINFKLIEGSFEVYIAPVTVKDLLLQRV